MSSLTVNESPELQIPQAVSAIEDPSMELPSEILERIIFITDRSENTRLVNHTWNTATQKACTASTFYEKLDLEKSLRLLIANLDPEKQSQYIADFREMHDTLQSFIRLLVTPAQVDRLFWVIKGQILGVLSKMTPNERDQLDQAIGNKKPDSLGGFMTHWMGSRMFELASLTTEKLAEAINNAVWGKDLKFAELLLHHGSMTEGLREEQVYSAARKDNPKLVKLLLANGPISELALRNNFSEAVMANFPEVVEVLLAKATGQSLEKDRNILVQITLTRHQAEIGKLLLDYYSWSERELGWTLGIASELDCREFVQTLLSHYPISQQHRGEAVVRAARGNNRELVKLLLANGPIPRRSRMYAIEEAEEHNNLSLVKLLNG